MQDFDKEFDLMVKNVLQDAEVKPSRRVWKGVSAHLKAQNEQKNAFDWSKWAYAALACAAIALGFLLFIPTKTDYPQNTYAALEQTEIQLPLNTMPKADIAFLETKTNSNSIPENKELNSEKLFTVIEEKEDNLKNETVEENKESTEKKEVSTKTIAIEEHSEKQAASRYFTQLEYEESLLDSRKSRLVSVYTRGALGSNDGFNAVAGKTAYLSPGLNYETDIQEISSSTYSVPLSFGLGARFYLIPQLSIGTGLNLNLLNRSFTGTFGKESGNVQHKLVYLGVPVNIYFDIVDFERLKFYAYTGGEIEFCLSNKYTFFSTPNVSRSSQVHQPQYSVTLGLGLEFELSRHFGIYLDPGMQYYFDCNQPKSVRTDKPLIFSFNAGLRFNF